MGTSEPVSPVKTSIFSQVNFNLIFNLTLGQDKAFGNAVELLTVRERDNIVTTRTSCICQKVDSEACLTLIQYVVGKRRGWLSCEGWTVPCLCQDGTVPFPIIVFIIRKLLQHNFPVFPLCGNCGKWGAKSVAWRCFWLLDSQTFNSFDEILQHCGLKGLLLWL